MTATLRSWTLPLSYTAPPLSQNGRMHWAAAKRARDQILSEVGWQCRAAKLPTGLARVEIVLHWQPAVRRPRDEDNPAPTLKAVVDAIVRTGRVVPDDSHEYVTSRTEIHPVARPARMWVTITEQETT